MSLWYTMISVWINDFLRGLCWVNDPYNLSQGNTVVQLTDRNGYLTVPLLKIAAVLFAEQNATIENAFLSASGGEWQLRGRWRGWGAGSVPRCGRFSINIYFLSSLLAEARLSQAGDDISVCTREKVQWLHLGHRPNRGLRARRCNCVERQLGASRYRSWLHLKVPVLTSVLYKVKGSSIEFFWRYNVSVFDNIKR